MEKRKGCAKNRDLNGLDLGLSRFTITNKTPQGKPTGHQSDPVENEKCLRVESVQDPFQTCAREKNSQVGRSSVQNNKTPKTPERTMLPSSSNEVETNNSLTKNENLSSKIKQNRPSCCNETKVNTQQNNSENEVSAKKMRIEHDNSLNTHDTSSKSSVVSNEKIYVPWKTPRESLHSPFRYIRKKCVENELERETRLKNNRDYINFKRTINKSKTGSRCLQSVLLHSDNFTSSPDNVKGVKVIINLANNLSKNEYLRRFDSSLGGLHEQDWAKKNIDDFHQSIQLNIQKCTICCEGWPVKSKPRNPSQYVCARCSRDRSVPKKFSKMNNMIPCMTPEELKDLTQVEEMLISRALPIINVFLLKGGQRAYGGHCINLPQNVSEVVNSLPRYAEDIKVIIVKMKGKNDTCKDALVRRQKVEKALRWLTHNNPVYKDIQINNDALQKLPDYGTPDGLNNIDQIDGNDDDANQTDYSSSKTDNENENVYSKDTQMSSFLPLPCQQEQETDALLQQLHDMTMNWPTVDNEPLSEFSTPFLATMSFPTLFPNSDGDPTNAATLQGVSFSQKIKHLLKIAEKVDGHWQFPLVMDPRFSYWAFDMIQRKRMLQQASVFLKQNPGEAHISSDELRHIAESNDSSHIFSKLFRYCQYYRDSWLLEQSEIRLEINHKSSWASNFFLYIFCS